MIVIYNILIQQPEGIYGGQLIRDSGFPSGSVYPALARLHAANLIAIDEDPSLSIVDGRSNRRKVYKLTLEGLSWAKNELRRLGYPVPALDDPSTHHMPDIEEGGYERSDQPSDMPTGESDERQTLDGDLNGGDVRGRR